MLRGGIGILIWLYTGLSVVGLAAMAWCGSFAALLLPEPMWAIHHLVVGAAGGGLLIFLSRVLERYISSIAALTHGFAQMLGPFGPRHAALAALASGVGEEIFSGVFCKAGAAWCQAPLFLPCSMWAPTVDSSRGRFWHLAQACSWADS